MWITLQLDYKWHKCNFLLFRVISCIAANINMQSHRNLPTPHSAIYSVSRIVRCVCVCVLIINFPFSVSLFDLIMYFLSTVYKTSRYPKPHHKYNTLSCHEVDANSIEMNPNGPVVQCPHRIFHLTNWPENIGQMVTTGELIIFRIHAKFIKIITLTMLWLSLRQEFRIHCQWCITILFQ